MDGIATTPRMEEVSTLKPGTRVEWIGPEPNDIAGTVGIVCTPGAVSVLGDYADFYGEPVAVVDWPCGRTRRGGTRYVRRVMRESRLAVAS